MGTARCSRAKRDDCPQDSPKGGAQRHQTRMPGGVGGAGSIPVPTRFGWSISQPRHVDIAEMVHIATKQENARYEDPEAKSISPRSGFLLVKTNTPRTAIQQIKAEATRAGKIIHAPIIRRMVPEGGSKYKIAPSRTPTAKVQIKARR
jgi:hypothetical protein